MADIITKVFTYNLPDDYLSQERTLGKTAEWTYIGPDEVCLVINKDTNTYAGKFFTGDHDHHNIPEALHEYHVHVDCSTNPLLCALAHCEIEKPDYADLDQHEELLPDGLTYKRPLHPPPDHTHNIADIIFDPVTKIAPTVFPWKQPHSNWDDLREWRRRILEESDGKTADDVPESVKAPWETFRQLLRDIPQIHGASNTHTTFDLTAPAPFNQVDSNQIKVLDATGIEVNDDVGEKGFPVPLVFDRGTRVVAVNNVTGEITLNKILIATPTELTVEISFSPEAETAPHKVGAHTAPDGSHGPLDANGNVQDVTAVGNVIKKFW